MEALLSQLAENGLVSLLLALAIMKWIEALKANDALQEKRLSDYKETQATVIKVLDEVKTTSSNVLQTILSRKK